MPAIGCAVRRLTAAFVAAAALFAATARVHAEVLIRWDQREIPSPQSLGVPAVVIPASNATLARDALAKGYRVWIEVERSTSANLPLPIADIAGIVVNGDMPAARLALLRQRLRPPARVVMLDARGKWPHIRTNWVTRNNDVLQVSSRSAQPWIENNAALMRIIRAAAPGGSGAPASFVTYTWRPITLSDADEGPDAENYLVAIAEAGSFGGDLLLPLHERLQKDLLLGQPRARATWDRIRRYIEFYSWDLPARYRASANVGVVSSDPMAWFEVMNLLARHNLPFELIRAERLGKDGLDAFAALIVLDRADPGQMKALDAYARKGGTVVIDVQAGARPGIAPPKSPWAELPAVLRTEERITHQVGDGHVVEILRGIPDPNRFALEVRELLGPQHRLVDIWNGITVIAAPYMAPDGASALVTALNYAHQPLPVQLRVAGTYSLVQYESPEEGPTLLPYQQRDGYTEFVLPALAIGGRVFLSRSP